MRSHSSSRVKRYPWAPSSVNRSQKRPRAPILKPSQHKSCWVLFPPRKLHAARSHEGTSTIGGEKDRRAHEYTHSFTQSHVLCAPRPRSMVTPRGHLGRTWVHSEARREPRTSPRGTTGPSAPLLARSGGVPAHHGASRAPQNNPPPRPCPSPRRADGEFPAYTAVARGWAVSKIHLEHPGSGHGTRAPAADLRALENAVGSWDMARSPRLLAAPRRGGRIELVQIQPVKRCNRVISLS